MTVGINFGFFENTQNVPCLCLLRYFEVFNTYTLAELTTESESNEI